MTRRFLLLLFLFVVASLTVQFLLPVLEGTDEPYHYKYILWLQATNRLPDRATYATNIMEQETGQPPLQYWLAAVALNVFGVPKYTTATLAELETVRNYWFTPPDLSNRADNFNMFFHGNAEQAFKNPDIVTGVHISRLIALMFGIIGVIGAYGAAQEIFSEPKWVLTATAIFAFTPQFVYMSSVLSNDISGTAFATLVIWQSLRLLNRGASFPRMVVLGLFIGLSGLSKVNALFIVLPAAALAVLLDWRRRKYPIKHFLANVLVLLPVVGIVLGPWILFGWLTFQDPFGLRTHSNVAAGSHPSLWQMLSALPGVYVSYWGKLGSNSVWMNPVVYALFTLVTILSVAGYIRYFRKAGLVLSTPQLQRVLVLGVSILVALPALLYWMDSLFNVAFAITARLVYPVHIAVVLAITAGLYLLAAKRSSQWLRLICISPFLSASLLVVPITLTAVYQTPKLLSQQDLQPLHGGPIDFDHTIRFLGYSQSSALIQQDQSHDITLCWQVLQPAQREAAFLLKIFDQNRNVVGERTSVHGMGHYDSSQWKTGDIFCDDVEVPITGPLTAGQTYNIELALMDSLTFRVDWQATDANSKPISVPIIGQLASPIGDMTVTDHTNWQATNITFPNFADLVGISGLDGSLTPGQTIHLKLLWVVKAHTPDNYSQFIHLIGPTSAVLQDGLPRGGQYPTWAWSPGEKIIDDWTFTLPKTLASGNYAIELGFYRQDTGQRMPVIDNGLSRPDQSAQVVQFSLP